MARRLAEFEAAGRTVIDDDLGMPPMPSSEHMLQAFMRLRPVRATSQGPEPWTWADIEAFGRASMLISEPWEHETLFDMSHAYAAELSIGTDPLTIPPTERGDA